MNVFKLHPEANAEHADAIKFYDSKGSAWAVAYHRDVKHTISKNCAHPRRFPKFGRNVRKLSTDTFDYKIIYSIEPNVILIVAVAHHPVDLAIGDIA